MKDMVPDHFERLIRLVEMERDAERKENQRRLEKLPVQEREALGKTVTRLVVTREDVGVGGLPLWILTRPSAGEEISPFQALSQGDLVRVSYQDPDGLQQWHGTLYDVAEFELTVALDTPNPPEAPTGKCQIDVLGSEATYKRMKKALWDAQQAEKRPIAHLRDVLLGVEKPVFEDTPAPSFFNPSLNEFQRKAVRQALAARDVALIHGPPGTGKTTVLVEIIRQAVAAGPPVNSHSLTRAGPVRGGRGARVLASAPSNIAVDNLLEKLLAANVRVVRLGHPARILEALRHATLAAQIAEHSDQTLIRDLDHQRERLIKQRRRYGERGHGLTWADRKHYQEEIGALWRQARDIEKHISRQILSGAEVILATHGGIAKPILSKPFDLLILDEASQATEPLSWIPLTQARKVVLAGDPLQLPPTIYSEEARAQGLEVTLLERLQKLLPAECSTLLLAQYRMHETLMGFSSREFYEDALLADDSVRQHTAAGLPGVQKNTFTQTPLVYVDTAGAGYEETWNDLLESRENKGEAELCATLYRELRESGLSPRHIALITPYAAQARLLRGLLRERALEVDSIDGFQGREKEAVILSLVRSNEKGEVGFLSDTRRMNVALTRARRLLIVVGDSATIARHPFYARLLEYIDAHDAHRSAWEWMS